ncbi:WXG100 family type VII secretion target [Streptomyces sp. PTM05]|uniref:WXG100 family type VII secretion target n=1 Tax=Streptantibioticus parmotrematis TaxID=2873249 RepID=A0ABS7QS91_9ACTN|nr:WXG100 family type VII secretion target [Streptantibioticus parmotrematis]MBY8886056.1 WXG100 family type VII secretion target [Streptantibioticus parmotrematis]
MTTYSVSHQQMQYVGGEMETITRNIQSTLTNLDDAAKQNLAQWSSDARDAYNVAKAKWDAAAAQMQHQAQTATQALGTIDGYYTSGEKYGVSLWEQ